VSCSILCFNKERICWQKSFENLSVFTCSICSKADLLYQVEAVILTAQWNVAVPVGFIAYIMFKRGFALI
jgi:hypothetical protein